MKWYKKQMDKLKAAKKITVKKSNDTNTKKSTPRHSFDLRKTGADNINFPNPVAISKLKRPKTDVH